MNIYTYFLNQIYNIHALILIAKAIHNSINYKVMGNKLESRNQNCNALSKANLPPFN